MPPDPAPLEEIDDLGPIEDEIEPDGDEGVIADAEGQGDAGGEPGADETGEDHQGGEAAAAGDVARSRPRSQETVRALRRRAQEAEAARDRERQEFDRRFRELEQRVSRPDPQAVQREAEARAVRRSMMSPEEVAQDIVAEHRQETNQRFVQLQLQTLDQADRSGYQTLKASDPNARRHEAEVERLLKLNRDAGNWRYTREDMLNYVVGKEIRERAVRARPGQVAEGARRLAGQRTRGGGGGGDAVRTRQGNEAEARQRRLESYRF